MTAPTPTLDRFTADALRIAAERQAELTPSDSKDEVLELAWKAAEAAVPTIPSVDEVEADLVSAEKITNAIAEAFVELARIVMTDNLAEIRTIMAAEAIRSTRIDHEIQATLVEEALKDQDIKALEANLLGGFHVFRQAVLFFIVNTQPGGTLDAAFDLILGLTDEDLTP